MQIRIRGGGEVGLDVQEKRGEKGRKVQRKANERLGGEGEGGLLCRLQGIKTSEIYSGLDWSGHARFGVASTKKGATLLVTTRGQPRYRDAPRFRSRILILKRS